MSDEGTDVEKELELRFASHRRRLDRMMNDPYSLSSGMLTMVWRWFRPRMKEPVVSMKELQNTLEWLRDIESGKASVDNEEDVPKRIDRVCDEYEANLKSVEQVIAYTGEVPASHYTWLQRTRRALVRAVNACVRVADTQSLQMRLATSVDRTILLPPLAVVEPVTSAETTTEKPAVAEVTKVTNLVRFQLDAVDIVLDAARMESDFLDRKRRLFEAARQLLLDTAAALPLDPEGVEQRQRLITAEITRITSLQAAGVEPNVALLHQAQSALARGDANLLVATLTAVEGTARLRGDTRVVELAGKALDRLWKGTDRFNGDVRASAMMTNARKVLGASVVKSIEDGYATGRAKFQGQDNALDEDATWFATTMQKYLADGNQHATLHAAMQVDGCIDAGAALTPQRVVEYEKRLLAVRYPSAKLQLEVATDVMDLPHAVIDDPRAVVLNLAAGRLLTRRYLTTETRKRTRHVMQGEVRVYVLDGSSSMLGPRARMRDAILVSELATMIERLNTRERGTRVTLFYRYFTDTVGPTMKVSTSAAAHAAIVNVLSTGHRGGTDIEVALLASLQMVREAQKVDSELARAQIVLITDGEAMVRHPMIERERLALGDLNLGISVIALGQENEALQKLVAKQRQAGVRAFYHFVSDATLGAIVSGANDAGPAMHLPAELYASQGSSSDRVRELQDLVGDLVNELVYLGRRTSAEAMEATEAHEQGLAEMGLDRTALNEAERARMDAVNRDRRALGARFARWFPAPVSPKGTRSEQTLPAPNTPERNEYDTAWIVLSTIAEMGAVSASSELQRQSDAIQILERLLLAAKLPIERFEELLRVHAVNLSSVLHAVHDSIRRGMAEKSVEKAPQS